MGRFFAAVVATAALVVPSAAIASTPVADVRLSNDCHPAGTCGAGYVSAYTMATGVPYTDATLQECTIAHARQNEPAVAVNPRDTDVLVGSSNDYCGVYNATDAQGNPQPLGPIWLGYYRSQDGGSSWTSSLVPGYPDDRSPYRALSQARTASAGDPVIAWDGHGRVFFGSESSDDPAGSTKTFGDVWVARYENPQGPAGAPANDGKAYRGTTVVAHGSSAPNLLGVFHDKTAIEADRTGGPCDGSVYFSWARFTGGKNSNIYFVRSTDHGASFSNPIQLTPQPRNLQDPDIAVTANGHVYVTFDTFATNSGQPDATMVVKSTDCGKTFGPPSIVTPYIAYTAQDVSAPEAAPHASQPDDPAGEGDEAPEDIAGDCGDFSGHCESGYTFFRRSTTTRSTADQYDAAHEWLYVVYDAVKPGTQVDTGTTYGVISPGVGGQTATFFVRYDGATGQATTPRLLDDQAVGHQTFPDISADGGVLHALWWDSRSDSCYSPARPLGNCADGSTVPALDVYATRSGDRGATWSTPVKVTDVMSNGNYEQFSDRTVPFGGDYLWVTSLGDFSFGTWTDWRNTVAGADPREATEDEDATTADVVQCRVLIPSTDKKGNDTSTWSGDRCPHAGGLDQDIYGDKTP
jgi:hypothetical protein